MESIIVGDTNCDYFDKSANDTSHLLKIINTFDLKQIISDYTRVTATTKTCIDHLITNGPVCVLDSGVLPCGISDHDAVFMVKNMRAPKLKLPPQSLSVRNYKKFDAQAFRNDIENLPFDQIKNVSQDANEMWFIWKSFFIDTLNKHAPVTKITVQNNRLPYATSDLKKLLRQRDYLRGKANKTGSKYLRQAFQQVRARANFELKKARREFFSNKIEQQKDNLKGMWKVLKKAVGQENKLNSIDQIQFNETTITDNKEIADVCNQHFVTIGERLASKIPGTSDLSNDHIPRVQSKFMFKPITESQVLQVIAKLVNSKATGLDGIPKPGTKMLW